MKNLKLWRTLCIALALLSVIVSVLLIKERERRLEAEKDQLNLFDHLLRSAKSGFENYLETGDEDEFDLAASDINALFYMSLLIGDDTLWSGIENDLGVVYNNLISGGSEACRDALPILIEGLEKALEGDYSAFQQRLNEFRNRTR